MKLTWLSVLGTTTRATHAMLDGVPADEDGLWELGGVRVPWPGHWSLEAGERCNCFPAGTLVSGSFNGAYRVRYNGVVAEIVTVGGIRLAVTPYHPILTLDGFLPACELKPGQKVVAHRLQVDDFVGLAAGEISRHAGIDFGNKEQDEPVAIEKVFEAFRSAAVSVEVKRADVDDFYGDGQFMPGEIEIVRPDWKLLSDGVSRLFEKRGDFIFALIDGELSEVSGLGSGGLALGRVNITSSSCPSLANPPLGIPIGCVTPTGSLAIGIAADFNPSFSKSSAKNRTAVIAFLRNALKGDTGLVSLDEVIEVRYFESSCHVYDLQSEYGVIVASGSLYTDNAQSKIGLVVGNCQCSLTSEMGMMGPEARQLIQDYNDRLSEYEAAAGEVWVKGGPGSGSWNGPGEPRFATDEGGGTAVEEEEPTQAGVLSDWEKTDYREQLDYWDGYRGTIGQHALHDLSKPAEEDRLYGIVKKDWRGGVQAIVCMTRNPSKIIIGTPNDGTYLKVGWFATKGPGHGRDVFGKIVERAVEMNSGIALESAPSAEGFYRKMGMVDKGRQFFYMTPEQCREWPVGSKDWRDDEEPEDGVFAVVSGELEGDEEKKFNPDQPRAPAGSPEGGQFGSGGGGSGSARERAIRTHKPSTKKKQRLGEGEQRRISAFLGGVNDEDNGPFDVIVARNGIEVKTVMDNDNDKITVHPESRKRKEEAAKTQRLRIHTVVVDVRGGRRQYYYRSGVGSFRLSAMERVSLAQLREWLL